MAARFGEKYSPGATAGAPVAGPQIRRARAGFRVNMLFLLPFVFLFPAFTGPATDLLLYLLAFGALELAAWLTREGQIAHAAYDARAVAKRPAIPRKLFASVLTGAGLALAGVAGGGGAVAAGIFAVLGAVLHVMAFGPDPLADKGVEGDPFQTDRVARAVDDAEARLIEMRDAVQRAGLPRLTRRVDAFGGTVRQMLRAVEDDPRDLTGARRFVGVYLVAARDATVQFADLYAKSGDEAARKDYEALLDDLEGSFRQKTETMLDNDKVNLDVEIEVLRDRLAREGVARRDQQ